MFSDEIDSERQCVYLDLRSEVMGKKEAGEAALKEAVTAQILKDVALKQGPGGEEVRASVFVCVHNVRDDMCVCVYGVCENVLLYLCMVWEGV